MGPDPPNSWEGEFPLPLVGLLVRSLQDTSGVSESQKNDTKEKLHRVKRQPMVKMVEIKFQTYSNYIDVVINVIVIVVWFYPI